MKANELRIGNLLLDELTKELLKVIEISETGFSTKVINRDKFPLPDGWKAKPIQLTEEWLLKFGFFEHKSGKESMSFTSSLYASPCFEAIRLEDGTFYFLSFNLMSATIEQPDLKYVHQLQNLYYALTGQELTLKP